MDRKQQELVAKVFDGNMLPDGTVEVRGDGDDDAVGGDGDEDDVDDDMLPDDGIVEVSGHVSVCGDDEGGGGDKHHIWEDEDVYLLMLWESAFGTSTRVDIQKV